MQNKSARSMTVLLSLFVASTTCSRASAGEVVTLGQLADATATLVIANAEAAKVVASSAGTTSGQISTSAHPLVGALKGAPVIAQVTKANGVTYTSIRFADGSVSDAAVGDKIKGGYVARFAADGAVVLVDAIGRVVSIYNANASAAAEPEAGHESAIPAPPPQMGPLPLGPPMRAGGPQR